MNDAKRARVVRGWMLCAVLMAGWLCWPSWLWLAGIPLFVAMCCCVCTVSCSHCTEGSASCEFQIVISDITNGTCSDCDALNGTWLLTFDDTKTCSTTFGWAVSYSTICTDQNKWGFNVSGTSPTTTVRDVYTGTPTRILYRETLTSQPTGPVSDCTLSSENIPIASGDTICTVSSSTCLLSSV